MMKADDPCIYREIIAHILKALRSFETPLIIYQSTRDNITEDLILKTVSFTLAKLPRNCCGPRDYIDTV
jgi:dihydrodipicolinate synthase/N-acetylneuraminate lyase